MEVRSVMVYPSAQVERLFSSVPECIGGKEVPQLLMASCTLLVSAHSSHV